MEIMRIQIKACKHCHFSLVEQGGVMYCNHPGAVELEDSYIITRSNQDSFPEKCLLTTIPVLLERQHGK